MIGFSPKGVMEAILVFPAMMVLALTIDVISVVLICFGLDDFGILDIIGLLIFGTWVFVRSGGQKDIRNQKPVSTKEKTAAIKKQGSTILKRLGRVGLRAGIIAIFEFIPYLGAILFGWTLLVIIEFVSDLRNFSMEAGE